VSPASGDPRPAGNGALCLPSTPFTLWVVPLLGTSTSPVDIQASSRYRSVEALRKPIKKSHPGAHAHHCRQSYRALPVVDGTPDARRRSASMAEPGYSGRKRGDVQFKRASLQHAGSGLWLGIEMAPGNVHLRDAFHSALQQVIATCAHAEVTLSRAILRADGAAGNVPSITSCAEAGVHYISRLPHYQLLQNRQVVGHLNETSWFELPSSSSGPSLPFQCPNHRSCFRAYPLLNE
jgi:hypothetical protein